MANTKVAKNSKPVGRPKGGKKLGGRQKGTPNKRTLEFVEALGSFDPVGALIEIYEGCDDWGIKLGAVREMLKYVYPQRKAIEVSAEKQELPTININGVKV